MRGSWFDRTMIHEPRPYSPMTRDRRPGIITSTATIVLLALCLPGAAQSHNVRKGTVTTDDGVRLYYRPVGTGQDVLVVPVAVWLSPHLDAQATGNRRIIYYDPRGHGRSARGDLARVSLDRATSDL